MKILLSIVFLIIEVKAYDYKIEDIQEAYYTLGYKQKNISKYLDKKIQIKGTIEDFEKNTIRLLVKNKCLKNGENHYLYFNLIGSKNRENNILASELNKNQEIECECTLKKQSNNFEDCIIK